MNKWTIRKNGKPVETLHKGDAAMALAKAMAHKSPGAHFTLVDDQGKLIWENKTTQRGMFGEDFEAGKWSPEELLEFRGESKPDKTKESQAAMFMGLNDDPDQPLLFGEQER